MCSTLRSCVQYAEMRYAYVRSGYYNNDVYIRWFVDFAELISYVQIGGGANKRDAGDGGGH